MPPPLALLAIAVALCLLPSAAAATPVIDNVPLAAGPRIVDGGVAWLEQSRRDWRVQVSRDGQPFTAAAGTLAGGDSSTEDGDDDDVSSGESVGGFTAAGRVATVELSSSAGNAKAKQYNSSSDVRRVALEPGGAAVAPSLSSCSQVTDSLHGGNVEAAIATDGRAIAVDHCGATKVFDAASGAVLAEYPTPGSASAPPAEPGGPVPPRSTKLALAGRFVASVAGAEVVVRDWQAGAEAYRVTLPAPPSPDAFAYAYGFDVQDDGALALAVFRGATAACGEGTLTWHTPAAPAGVPLPAVACSAAVAVDGGRAAVVAEAPGGQVIAEVAPDGTRRDLDWAGTGRSLTGGLDYAAGTAAYALERCAGRATLHVSSGDPTPEPVDCPRISITGARVRGAALRVRGKVAAGVTGRLSVVYRAGGRSWRRSVRESGGRFSARLRLPARARRRAGRLAVAYAGDTTYLPETQRLKVRARRR